VMKNAIFYFEKILAIPGAVDYMSELSYHRYSGVSRESLETIAHLAEENGINTSMLEWIGATHETLHEDLKIGNNSAWQQYTLAYCGKNPGSAGGAYFGIDNQDPSNPRIVTGWRTTYLRQYFKYIKPGAVRIEAATSNRDFDPVAFINPGGLFVVVVKADKAGEIAIEGLPPGTYEISHTTEEGLHPVSPVTITNESQNLTTSIPAKGVVTVSQSSPKEAKPIEQEPDC